MLVTTLLDRMIRDPDEEIALLRIVGEIVLVGLVLVGFDWLSARYGNFRVALVFGAAFLGATAWFLRFELFGVERHDKD